MLANDGFGSNRYKVSIEGNCKPTQYVPMDVCFNQFWNRMYTLLE